MVFFEDKTATIIAGLAAYTALAIAIIQVSFLAPFTQFGTSVRCVTVEQVFCADYPAPQALFGTSLPGAASLRISLYPWFAVGRTCALRAPAETRMPLRPCVPVWTSASLSLRAPCCMQRYIVRIIFMIPVYSLASFPSLLAPQYSIYWVTVRDW